MSKASRARYEANRNNAQHSRGPVSEQGKKRSSQNALRHGLTGRIVVLPTEDMEVYQGFSKELVDSLHPATPMEAQFAQTVADTQWRLNRARTFEDGMLALGNDDFNTGSAQVDSALSAARVFREHSKDFVNLSLYEQRLSRAQKEAFKQLQELQAKRKSETDMRLPAASQTLTSIPEAEASLTVPATSKGIGFVYSAASAASLTTARVCQPEDETCKANGFRPTESAVFPPPPSQG